MGVLHPVPVACEIPLRMAFQPIVAARTGRVFAYEALVRGPDGDPAREVLARVAPNQRRSFDRRCRATAMRAAIAAGINNTDAMLAINFMPDTIESPSEDGHQMVELAEQLGISPRKLMFEFSEQPDMDAQKLGEIIKTYRRCGFMTTYEDFGASSTGLGMLGGVTPDYIKLDATLIGGIAGSWSRRLVAENLVSLATDLRIKVIAEGVETASDMEKMHALGIEYFQGFFICAPELETLPRPAPPKLK